MFFPYVNNGGISSVFAVFLFIFRLKRRRSTIFRPLFYTRSIFAVTVFRFSVYATTQSDQFSRSTRFINTLCRGDHPLTIRATYVNFSPGTNACKLLICARSPGVLIHFPSFEIRVHAGKKDGYDILVYKLPMSPVARNTTNTGSVRLISIALNCQSVSSNGSCRVFRRLFQYSRYVVIPFYNVVNILSKPLGPQTYIYIYIPQQLYNNSPSLNPNALLQKRG